MTNRSTGADANTEADQNPATWQAGLAPALRAGLGGRKIPALDGLRAIAAWTVVFYHLGFGGAPGSQAVMLFFVLSGFLITWLLLDEEERRGAISLRGFYIRRSLRIFPPFYAYWLASVVAMQVMRQPPEWPVMWASFFYVSNWYHAIHGVVGSAVSHCWSLGLEEQYYLLWPLAFFWLGHHGKRRHIWVGVVIVAVWLNRFFAVQRGVSFDYVYHALDTRADHVLVGTWLALALRAGKLRALMAFLQRHLWLVAVNVLLLLWQFSHDLEPGQRGMLGVGFLFEPILFALLIVQLVAHHAHPTVRWLDHRVMTHLGMLSYSTYLWHQLPVAASRKLFPEVPWLWKASIAVVVVLLLAHGSYYFVERPFLRWKDRLTRRAHTAE